MFLSSNSTPQLRWMTELHLLQITAFSCSWKDESHIPHLRGPVVSEVPAASNGELAVSEASNRGLAVSKASNGGLAVSEASYGKLVVSEFSAASNGGTSVSEVAASFCDLISSKIRSKSSSEWMLSSILSGIFKLLIPQLAGPSSASYVDRLIMRCLAVFFLHCKKSKRFFLKNFQKLIICHKSINFRKLFGIHFSTNVYNLYQKV